MQKVIAESWAYYMRHVMTERKYGIASPEFVEQFIGYNNNAPVFGLSSNLNLLEDFSPLRTDDPFRWIPQGMFYDLVDNRNDNIAANPPRVLLDDNVNGYTNQQFFNALDGGTISLTTYRDRLLQQTNNNPVGVTQIFSFYGY